jgi:NAD-dependent deacetylase
MTLASGLALLSGRVLSQPASNTRCSDKTEEVNSLSLAHALLSTATRVTVLSGAGLSTASGIPDFRGPQGLWTTNPGAEALTDIETYVTDAEIRKLAWQNRLHSPLWSAAPNAGHAALVELERQGRLLGIVTQNIDGLHQAAGSDPQLVVEVHGSAHRSKCLSCGHEQPIGQVLARVADGDLDPRCEAGVHPCGGLLKAATISFGQSLDPTSMPRASDLAMACDVLICLGSTLGVYPVASIVPLAKDQGAKLIICNKGRTSMDDLADVLVDDDLAVVVPALVAL